MKKNNILLVVTDNILLDEFKDESAITFLFPLQKFTVGFLKTYDILDINVSNAYIYVNRLLDNDSILELKKILLNLPPNIKGIVFDDIGILNIIIEEKIALKTILFMNHLNCNYLSINEYLNYVDSVVVSSDITNAELDLILQKALKPLVAFGFGHVNVMYSRRKLITNYNRQYNDNFNMDVVIKEKISNQNFQIIENEYGTVFYTPEPFNNLENLSKSNVLFCLINPIFLPISDIKCLKNNFAALNNKYSYKYLSEKATIFNLKEDLE